MLSGLAEEAKAQSDDNTWRFLTLLAEEQQQDGCCCKACLRKFAMPIKPVSVWNRPIAV
jgi:ferritin-like protein 2